MMRMIPADVLLVVRAAVPSCDRMRKTRVAHEWEMRDVVAGCGQPLERG